MKTGLIWRTVKGKMFLEAIAKSKKIYILHRRDEYFIRKFIFTKKKKEKKSDLL